MIVPFNRLGQNRARKSLKSRAKSASLAAPVGGWNARDALGAMDPLDAVSMVNMFPTPTMVQARYGYSRQATGIPGQVETLLAYAGGTTEKLFAIGGNAVYDVTTAGAVGAAALSGLTNSRWQYVNITTSGGSYIAMVNGADTPYTYDGTTWATTSITGLTSSSLIGINAHKNRLWFIQTGTLKAWYLPTQSIAGAANALDLSAFATRGGYLMAMGTWTIDAGYGVDDLAVFITSEGEAIVYRGTDPSSATTWALVGIYQVGAPIGRRCFVKYKGDLLLITQDGVIPLAAGLQSSRLDPRVSLTNKIESVVTSATSTYSANFGWQLMPWQKQGMLILNVPVQQGSVQQQYVMNTINGAWCNFQGWSANCWEVFGDNAYFGGNTYVGKAWDTQQDNATAISYNALQAFNYFDSPGQLKRFTMLRPTFYINANTSIQGDMRIDFDLSDPSSNLQTAPVSGALWDAGTWDASLWADTLSLSRVWQGATGVGYCAGPRIAGSANGHLVQWVSTDVVMEPGAIL